jgi:hypothetical protein
VPTLGPMMSHRLTSHLITPYMLAAFFVAGTPQQLGPPSPRLSRGLTLASAPLGLDRPQFRLQPMCQWSWGWGLGRQSRYGLGSVTIGSVEPCPRYAGLPPSDTICAVSIYRFQPLLISDTGYDKDEATPPPPPQPQLPTPALIRCAW